MAVVAATSPGMSVTVSQGSARISTGTYPTSYGYFVAIDTTSGSPAGESVTITTANSSNPRIDTIVAYVDLSVTASNGTPNNPNNMLKVAAVAGTPAGSPSAPNTAAIQSAIGAANPYIILANVLVGTSVTQITNSNITDLRTFVGTNPTVTSPATAGWLTLSKTPNTVAYNGNRSYTLTFNGVDVTGTLSPGMRIRTTRTVAAPTQCTSLNGTTQFYSKTSPAGMTFTNNFTVSAWVKLTSSGSAGIITRYNGTSGWLMQLNSSGQVQVTGLNGGSSNFRQVQSYQSLPLNKWVHIYGILDMSGFTTATCKIMIDGVDVPVTLNQGGTNPTSLVQAGNLEIGSYNGGTNPFPGKIAQAAVWSAQISEATMQGYITQGLAGTETNLISAYSFNNSINDLNANANNLTANGSAVATNADSPFGGQAGGSISSTLDYGIVQSATFSTNSTVVVQCPEGCTIPTSGGVSAVAYAGVKAPYGMPVQRAKFAVKALYKTQINGGTTAGTWVNVGQVTSPLGEWSAGYQYDVFSTRSTAGACGVDITLSTSNNSETDQTFSARINGNNVTEATGNLARRDNISVAAQAVYYINITPTQSGQAATGVTGTGFASDITFENAYL